MDSITKADYMEAILLKALGAECLLDNMQRALDTDTKIDIYEYIAGNHDIRLADDEDWEY